MSKHSKLQRELLDIQSPTYSRKAEKEINEFDTKLSLLPTTINYDKPINEEGDTTTPYSD